MSQIDTQDGWGFKELEMCVLIIINIYILRIFIKMDKTWTILLVYDCDLNVCTGITLLFTFSGYEAN